MADNDYSSIGPLNKVAQQEAVPFIGYIALLMVVTFVALFIIGAIVNSID